MLDDKTQTASLQGWAIVENQTESDWKDVSLSLVSGRPISFTMDLYQPLYASRPNVVPEMYAGLRPQVYDAGLGAARDRVGMTSGAVGNATPAQARRIGVGPDGRPFAAQLQEVVVTGASSSFDNFNNSVESIAAAAKLGELFQYTVSDVTLARQKSAMLPIVTDTLHAERLSIYNASVLRSNPLNGVLLKNTTGKHLLQGPVTVLDKGGYAGDARIDNVPPGQERLLSYGIDLDVVVTGKGRETSNIVSASIDHGMMRVQRKEVSSTEYTADNKSTHDKTLLIEYPLRQGWKLVDTQKPFETTPSLYRFKGKALADKATVLTITEARVDSETIRLGGLDSNTVLAYSRTGEVASSVRDALLKVLERHRALAEIQRQIQQRSQRINEIAAEQTRIRENMKTVSAGSQYYDRLLQKLNEQESMIEKLQSERGELTTSYEAARRDLDAFVSGLVIG
ncbi:MAG TPA: hypothetical protein VGM50_07105, partial [Gemmatimonadaceae bacterium]